ncbi:MAG TPA: Lrp/AsnC ligand binding domain-containing protein [Pseudonocardia sp.]|nr:Lrp/AsnC ligand binding domain-containing protein [Pseudonocardia sp.]
MVRAYVLVQTEIGMAGAVAAEIAGIPGVTEAEDITGPYDVIARVEADALDTIAQIVGGPQFRAIKGIARTVTCPVVHIT